ncbi:MAG TPA: PIG-L family deacetylase [Vicinamibacteria bacterium]|nr:PIG-L family deacetylase [Vicinamibacteria bacterium]
MIPRRVVLAALAGLLALAPAAPAESALPPLDLDRGASGLALALRKVGVSGRVLYVTAHPDDEMNGVLVRLSRGLGLRTALLTVTRGEGGQNAIGPELFEALGVLRTGELMALHRYDGVEQYFGRAYEFGFSFSVEETFAKWGREETLGDVVRVVRAFRPDVILTLPHEGGGGGQHHQAVGRLAREAFRAAADPARFADQLRAGLRPWQARKIYEGAVGGFGRVPGTPVHVPIGVYDPVLGMTWQQLGSRARAMHRCQGESQLRADAGPAEGLFTLIDAEPAVTGAEADILDGVPTSLASLSRFAPGLGADLDVLQSRAAAARAAFDPASPEKAAPALAEALTALRALAAGLDARVADPLARAEVAERLRDEERDDEAALTLAQGLVLEARAEDGLVTPGQTLGVRLSLFDGVGTPVDVESLDLEAPAGWTVVRREGEPGPLAGGGVRKALFSVVVAPDARPSQPYWRREKDRDRNELLVPADETLPWSPPALAARVRCRVDGADTTLRVPVAWRYEGPFVGGERQYEVQVVPALSVRVSPDVTAVPLASARRPVEVRVFARNLSPGAATADLRLEAPAGWTVDPPSAALRLAYEGEEGGARFRVTPPSDLRAGTLVLRAVAVQNGREYHETVQAVDYDHVERRQLLRPAETRLLVLDARTAPGAKVGYVMGSGDALADAIRQMGVPLALLSGDDLIFGDLSRFSTIVTGIRAYETRPDLRASHGRLMRWVEAGGHLVVQYNRAAFNRLAPEAPPLPADAPSPYAPFPAAVTPERISDETAPMRILVPSHPLLTAPNRIGPTDWEGWVQERGIQFLAARDPRYTDILAATDPFPENPGEKRGILVEAKVGKGTWTYVGLALFRQVPAGVPGGWRLLANLISRPQGM